MKTSGLASPINVAHCPAHLVIPLSGPSYEHIIRPIEPIHNPNPTKEQRRVLHRSAATAHGHATELGHGRQYGTPQARARGLSRSRSWSRLPACLPERLPPSSDDWW